MNLAELDATMQLHGVGPEVRARVLRLNPKGVEPGKKPKGYNPKYAMSRIQPIWVGHIKKSTFIKEFGRDAWSKIPVECIVKDGRRRAITREAYLDNVWKGPA